ncbi:MAG: HlyC/CorC family transporter [Ruminococcaceae bacterium]|nr:HlyC/CorC family transporter [Oscillospiraceae bacterium]
MEIHIIIIVVCVILSAYFSATETAFSTFNRIRIKNMAEKGNKKAALVLKLADNYDSLISTILIGNNIVNILASAMGTLLFAKLIVNQDLAATVSTAVLTVVILVFGEISPKTMAKNSPESFVLFSAPIINFLYIILTPFNLIFRGWQKLLAKLFKKEDDQGMTEEELISIIEEAEEDGDIDKEESDLIKSAIEFGDLEVGDIFTPRIDVTGLPKDATKETVAKTFAESGYSRLPVYEGDIDNIVGILYYKDFYTTAYKTSVSLDEIIKPVIFVAKTQPVNELMKELQEKQLHMAIVTDEFGSTAGIVTLEDILEEIVGEIWDEHDEIVEEIKELGEKEYIVSGKANTEKLFSLFDIDTEEEIEAVTVGGWAMEVLGKIPEVGDSFEEYGLAVEVVEMDGRRVENVHVTDVRASEDEEDSEDDESEVSEE